MKKSPNLLLKQAYLRKKRKTPSLSLRRLAEQLDISHTYLSRIFSGRKNLPTHLLQAFCDRLEIDSILQAELTEALLAKSLERVPGIERLNSMESLAAVTAYEHVLSTDFSIHERWYYIAILDAVTCVDFQKDSEWIANRVGISRFQAETAVHALVEKGFLREENGTLVKSTTKPRFSIKKGHPTLRAYHSEMITKAQNELETATDQESFEKRSIAGISIAANPKNLARAQERLQVALHEIAQILSEGECTELYHLNAQLFPLVNPRVVSKKKSHGA